MLAAEAVVRAMARVQVVLVEAPELRTADHSRAFPIRFAERTSAGLAGPTSVCPEGPATGLAGTEVGVGPDMVGVQRRSVLRQLERGWRMQAPATVTRTMDPATLGHMR